MASRLILSPWVNVIHVWSPPAASGDGGQQVQMRRFCRVILCRVVCDLDPGFDVSFHTPNLSFSITETVCYLRLPVRWRVHGKPARGWFLEMPAKTHQRLRSKINTFVDEYRRGQKVCARPDYSTLLGSDVCNCLALHSSVHLRGAEHTKCDRGIFCWLVVWRCGVESRFRIFCPSKLSPLQPLQRRLHCTAACTKIDADNRTAYAAKWKEKASLTPIEQLTLQWAVKPVCLQVGKTSVNYSSVQTAQNKITQDTHVRNTFAICSSIKCLMIWLHIL